MTASSDSYLIHCPACGIANRVPASSEGRAGTCGNCREALPPLYSRPMALTDRNFDTFVENYPGPVMAEFWAPW